MRDLVIFDQPVGLLDIVRTSALRSFGAESCYFSIVTESDKPIEGKDLNVRVYQARTNTSKQPVGSLCCRFLPAKSKRWSHVGRVLVTGALFGFPHTADAKPNMVNELWPSTGLDAASMGLHSANVASASQIQPIGDEYFLRLSGYGVPAWFSDEGMRVEGLRATPALGLRFVSWGSPGEEVGVDPTRPVLGDCSEALLLDGTFGRCLEYHHPDITAWWVGRQDGVEFGWTVWEAPEQLTEHTDELSLRMTVSGSVWMERRDGNVELADEGGREWTISGAVAWDALGNSVPAWVEIEGDDLVVLVDTHDVIYPLTVDPVLSTASIELTDYFDFGYSVAGLGDVNGDGFDDIAVGAPGYGVSSIPNRGAVYVYHGSSGGVTSTTRLQLVGLDGGRFGTSVSAAGDVNGDGYDDLIVGAYSVGTLSFAQSGRAYVFHGSAAGLSTSPASTLDGLTDGEWFGWSVSGGGDLNGDGFDDVVVGSPNYDLLGSEVGAASIFHGGIFGIETTATNTFVGQTHNDNFGSAVSIVGDVDGDGYSDVAIAAPGRFFGTGRVYIYHGSSSGLETSARLTIDGDTVGDDFGESLSGAGDVNGDGYADILVGAGGYDSNRGAAYLFHGSSTGIGSTSNRHLVGLDPYAGFGSASSGAGDVNGDGFDDIVVGAYFNSSTRTEAGSAHLYHGSVSGVESSPVNSIYGAGRYYNLGLAVSKAGDVNGDGYGDALISAVERVYVHHGCADDDGDGVCIGGDSTAPQDCDDADASIGAVTTLFVDADGDGVGSSISAVVCEGTPGYVGNHLDCDDADAGIGGLADLHADADGDGYGAYATVSVCEGEAGYVEDGSDCDDSDPTVTLPVVVFFDDDGDGYGSTPRGGEACPGMYPDYIPQGGDCDDSDAGVNPGAVEVCDRYSTDENCDGLADDGDPSVDPSTYRRYFPDLDEDGWGAEEDEGIDACEAPSGTVANSGDCDDSRPDVNPDMTEICDPFDTDEDCNYFADDGDRNVDDSSRTTYYADADADGFGSPDETERLCNPPEGYVEEGGDCDDTRFDVNPSALEVCDTDDADEDCDGLSDDADPSVDTSTQLSGYLDSDGDGFGNNEVMVFACEPRVDLVSDNRDCDDREVGINPSASEVPGDGIDQDCDGSDGPSHGDAESKEPVGCVSVGARAQAALVLLSGLIPFVRRRVRSGK